MLEIDELEFKELKHEQQLLVDFNQFPYKLVELFELLIESSIKQNPKFFGQLVQDPVKNTAIFSILEANSFKSIDHLSLKFAVGTDSTIKHYLGQMVKDLKSDKMQLQQSIQSISTGLQDAENIQHRLSSEINDMKCSHNDELNAMKSKFENDLQFEKDKLCKEIESLKQLKDDIYKSDIDKHDSEVFILIR